MENMDKGLTIPKCVLINFFENTKILGLDRQIGPKTLGAFGVFWADFYQSTIILQKTKRERSNE